MSQQNASRTLTLLEKNGYVERKEGGIILTKKACGELGEAYAAMKRAFEGGKLEIRGTIVRGLGDGKYYLSLGGYRKQIKKMLGFMPFPGTLNVKMAPEGAWKRQQLLKMEPIIISGFADGKRTYGDLFAYRCRLEGMDCAIIIPMRTHHGPDVIEVISRFDIKKKLGKKDGGTVRLVVS
jgi:riboflavin kinase